MCNNVNSELMLYVCWGLWVCDLKVFALQQLQNKVVDGVGQITAVHLWGQTAGAEQMLSWFIVEDYNIVFAWQSIWEIQAYVWNDCVNFLVF